MNIVLLFDGMLAGCVATGVLCFNSVGLWRTCEDVNTGILAAWVKTVLDLRATHRGGDEYTTVPAA